ncbi:MAG TPA: hypothetical protein VGI81_25330 [Tepidisphaeraceae bacterium]|jgi:hypothetical protein
MDRAYSIPRRLGEFRNVSAHVSNGELLQVAEHDDRQTTAQISQDVRARPRPAARVLDEMHPLALRHDPTDP